VTSTATRAVPEVGYCMTAELLSEVQTLHRTSIEAQTPQAAQVASRRRDALIERFFADNARMVSKFANRAFRAKPAHLQDVTFDEFAATVRIAVWEQMLVHDPAQPDSFYLAASSRAIDTTTALTGENVRRMWAPSDTKRYARVIRARNALPEGSSHAAIAEAAKVAETCVERILSAPAFTSLDEVTLGAEVDIDGAVCEPAMWFEDDVVDADASRELMGTVLQMIPDDQDRFVFVKALGLDGSPEMTQHDIAEATNLTPSQVRSTLRAIRGRLQHPSSPVRQAMVEL
jgi:hypothetical protein